MKQRRNIRLTARWVMLALVLAMVASACGGSSSDETSTTAAGGSETSTTAGSGGGSETTTTAGTASGEKTTLTVVVPAEHLTMDPQHHRNIFTQIVSRKVHDNLVYVDPLEPEVVYTWKLATGYEQVDDTTYDLTLREGVFFHDGTPFTSESVVYTYERLLDPDMNSPRASMQSQSLITSVEALDDYTVRFTTSGPIELTQASGKEGDPLFPVRLGTYSQEMLKPGYYDGLSLEETYDYPTMGTGPWKFVEWEQGQFIRFEANADYWDGPPKVDELVIRFIPEASTRAAELIAGSVDLLNQVDADTMSALAGQPGIEVQSVPGNSMTMLQTSVQEGRLFADRDLRLGLNAAIDRKLIVDNLFSGLAFVENQMTSVLGADSTPTGYDNDWEGFQYDPELATELLAPVSETVQLHTSTTNALIAEVIAEQLRAVGLDVEVVAVDNTAMSAAIDSGEYDLWIQEYGSLHDIGNNWNTHFSCATNEAGIVRTGYCKPELDAMIEGAQDLDPAGKAPIYLEVGRALNEDPPWVPLWTLDRISAYRDYVNDYYQSPAGQLNLWTVSLEK